VHHGSREVDGSGVKLGGGFERITLLTYENELGELGSVDVPWSWIGV